MTDPSTDTRAPMKDVLRALPVLQAQPPRFDVDAAPDDPTELFRLWLDVAITRGIDEPHAMTVSTLGGDGVPDARVLILKDLVDGAWCFAGRSDSVKGRQLEATPAAALTFYWPALGRQIRIRGPVRPASSERSAADFADRSVGSQAAALTGRQSTPLDDPAAVRAATSALQQRLDNGEITGLEAWTLWAVEAEHVEFWQADPDREHIRLAYVRDADGWRHGLLWP